MNDIVDGYVTLPPMYLEKNCCIWICYITITYNKRDIVYFHVTSVIIFDIHYVISFQFHTYTWVLACETQDVEKLDQTFAFDKNLLYIIVFISSSRIMILHEPWPIHLQSTPDSPTWHCKETKKEKIVPEMD